MPNLFQVGGCVRDNLLGLTTKDIDFTFVLDNLDQSVEEGFNSMKSWMIENGYKIFLEVPAMFTIRAKFPKDHIYKDLVADFVMARKEVGYEKDSRRPILQLGTLHDDLIRRDFTVNAMALDSNGKILDPFNGAQDLFWENTGILRTPLPAKSTMLDDPLRFIRALRFKITKGFSIDDSIYLSVMENPEIFEKLEVTVSSERIREELQKMFKHDTISTLNLLYYVDQKVKPGFLNILFKKGMWLKPTFEK